jgi:hypothetical protein
MTHQSYHLRRSIAAVAGIHRPAVIIVAPRSMSRTVRHISPLFRAEAPTRRVLNCDGRGISLVTLKCFLLSLWFHLHSSRALTTGIVTPCSRYIFPIISLSFACLHLPSFLVKLTSAYHVMTHCCAYYCLISRIPARSYLTMH